jgi:hypothetical protein
MDHTPAKAPTLRAPLFRDGLGERRRMADASGVEKVEVLCLRKELATADGFEAALRERVTRLSTFRNAAFARVRTVERLNDPAATLVVVSEPTKVIRLSELLNVADRHELALDGTAEWCLIKQLVAAVSTLHHVATDIAHGAIALERVVITPEARVVVTEHVLGPALQQLGFSSEQYWKELRIACAPMTTELNQRADVAQIGTVALSLFLNRPLSADEYPLRVEQLLESAWAKSAAIDVEVKPTPSTLRSWLAKALQLDPRQSFASAVEAGAELDKAIVESGYMLQRADLDAFLVRCQQHADMPRPAAVVATPVEPQAAPEKAPAAADKSATTKAEKPATSSAPVSPHKTSVLSVTRTDEPQANEAAKAAGTYRKLLGSAANGHDWRRKATAAAVVIGVVGVGWIAASRYFEVSAEKGTTAAVVDVPAANTTAPTPDVPVETLPPIPTAPSGGQLEVRSDPAGATVTLDGVRRGVTPLTLNDVPPGRHTVVIDNGIGTPTMRPVVIESGLLASVVAQLAPAPVTPATGFLTVSAPGDLQLFENGRLLGTSQGGRITLAPGPHQIEFINDALGYRSTRTVHVSAGSNASVNIDFPKGPLALNAVPWAEVWVDGEHVGETPIGNLPVSLGTHEVVFRNPELGEQRMVATVTLTAPTRLSVDLRKK